MVARLLLVALTLTLAVAGLALSRSRESARSDPATKSYSEKRSTCGRDVGVWASDLGLERARELTLCLLNEERAREGRPALSVEPRLQAAAQDYASEMVTQGFFAHNSPRGSDFHDRLLNAGYPAQAASTGENLAWGTGSEQSPVETVDGWMHSPGHRRNILEPAFTEIGIGIVFAIPVRRAEVAPGATYATSFGGPPVAAPAR